MAYAIFSMLNAYEKYGKSLKNMAMTYTGWSKKMSSERFFMILDLEIFF